MDIRQDELGDLVDKEMASTSAAIEEAVRRIDVSNALCVFLIRHIECHIQLCNCSMTRMFLLFRK